MSLEPLIVSEFNAQNQNQNTMMGKRQKDTGANWKSFPLSKLEQFEPQNKVEFGYNQAY